MDRRKAIVEAAMAVLREGGYVALTQPRVAALVGIRQSHLTYYFPTRLDLLGAVGRAVVDRQLAIVNAALPNGVTREQAASALTDAISRHENTRTLLALAQASDDEPTLKELFRELVDGFVERAEPMFRQHADARSPADSARLLQATIVGLAIVQLATGRSDAQDAIKRILSAGATDLAARPEEAPQSRDSISNTKEPR